MTQDLFCERLVLDRVQFQLAQLAALVRSMPLASEDAVIHESLKLLLMAMDRDIRLAIRMLPNIDVPAIDCQQAA